MKPHVHWSPFVKAAVPLEVLTNLRRTATDYNCFACHHDGNATRERTTVILITGTEGAPPVLQLAHARCAPSQIVTLDGPTIDLTDTQSLAEDVVSVGVLWPSPTGPLAGLILDRHASITVIHNHGDTEDPWVQFLLSHQWELAFDIGQEFPIVTTTTTELDHQGHGRILTTNPDTVLLDQLPDVTPQWTTAAHDRGIIRIYAGDIGIHTHPDGTTAHAALMTAISAGRVVGAYVPVS